MPHSKDKKRYKDPVYGYIEIERDLFEQFIDTPEFQRLRYIRQTGYTPVYSSATHNRFVHSIGVYYLGTLAFDALQSNLEDDEMQLPDGFSFEDYRPTFLKACLLHDVGHAPFSHTGEGFYRMAYEDLDGELVNLVSTESFRGPSSRADSAVPHETMSAIVGISVYGNQFESDFDRELFARCITGYPFDGDDPKSEILNAIISLLNSKTIDVDKLDYLIRDSYETGFKTTVIDYERLLSGVTLTTDKKYDDDDLPCDTYALAFKSGAISVLENVVLARDSEKRWIQNHPIILFEDMLLKNMMTSVSEEFFGGVSGLFNRDSLIHSGHDTGRRSVRLLCDDDILCYAKRLDGNRYTALFFDRGSRHKPVWKSEEEFEALVGIKVGEDFLPSAIRSFASLASVLIEVTGLPFINIESVKALEGYIKEKQDTIKNDATSAPTLRDNIKRYENALKIARGLMDLPSDKARGEFAVIATDEFNSGFASGDLGDTLITIKGRKTPVRFKQISRLFDAEAKNDKFFYVYANNDARVDITRLIDWIIKDIAVSN